jgi:hypothetical protein
MIPVLATLPSPIEFVVGIVWSGDHREAGEACKPEIAQSRCHAINSARVSTANCEARHTQVPASALITGGGHLSIEVEQMKTRRIAYWWFRLVASGRFLEKFLRLRGS